MEEVLALNASEFVDSDQPAVVLLIPCEEPLAKKWDDLKLSGSYTSDSDFLGHLLKIEEFIQLKKVDRTFLVDAGGSTLHDGEHPDDDFFTMLIDNKLSSEPFVVVNKDSSETTSAIKPKVKRAKRKVEPKTTANPFTATVTSRSGRTCKVRRFLGASASKKDQDDELTPTTSKRKIIRVKIEKDEIKKELNDVSADIDIDEAIAELDPKPKTPRTKRKRATSSPNKRESLKQTREIVTVEVYTCPICATHDQEKTVIEEHLQTHDLTKTTTITVDSTTAEISQCTMCESKIDLPDDILQHAFSHIAKCLLCSECQCIFFKSSTKHHSCPESFMINVNDETRLAYHCVQQPERGFYCCAVCTKKFAKFNGMLDHLRLHAGVREHMCDTCGKQFSSASTLKSHLSVHTSKMSHCCETCGVAFKTKFKLNVHVSRNHGDGVEGVPPTRIFKCKHCTDTFKYRINFVDHMASNHQNVDRFSCVYCDKQFITKHGLNVHLSAHEIGRSHSCQFCGRSFAAMKARDKHEAKLCKKGRKDPSVTTIGANDENNENNYEVLSACPLCATLATHRHLMDEHVVQHEQVLAKVPLCAFCNFEHADNDELFKHILEHVSTVKRCSKCETCYSPTEKHVCGTETALQYGDRYIAYINHEAAFIYRCVECDYECYSMKFPPHESLMKHLRTHGGLYSCDLCGKMFESRRILTSHRNCHFVHVCDLCGTAVKGKANLFNHKQVVHNNIRKHMCSTCGAKFTSKKKLSHHMNIHTGERPFACKTCGKSFTHPSHLKRHIMLHTGERPHRCQFCDRGFINISNYKDHLKTHTGERPYKCTICSEGFITKRNLQKHLHLKHNSQLPLIVVANAMDYQKLETVKKD